jgi:putative hydrolase of the HAD superfamily
MPGEVDLVLFDVDGVLIRPWGFRDHLQREHDIPPERTQPFFRGPFVECLCGRADLREVLPPFMKQWGWAGTLEELLEVWFREDGDVDTELLSVVDRLRARGTRCGIATSQERLRAAHLASSLGFADRFDELFFSCELGASKPDPEYFSRVEARTRIAPARTLFFDDAEPNVAAARANGWRAHVYTGRAELERALADEIGE